METRIKPKQRRGISTFIAALLLIVLAVAAGVMVYAYTMGYLGGTPPVLDTGILQVQSIAQFDSGLHIYLKNIGKGTVKLDEQSRLYVNDKNWNQYSPKLAEIIEGKTLDLVIYEFDSSYIGKTASIKIVTGSGGVVLTTAKITQESILYSITPSVIGGHGVIIPGELIKVPFGGTPTYEFIADKSYHIDSVMVDGEIVVTIGPPYTYTFPSVTKNHVIDVKYEYNGVTSTRSPSSNAGNWINGEEAYRDDLVYSFSADDGEHQYGNYGFTIPSDAVIGKVSLRLDAYCKVDDDIMVEISLGGANFTLIDLSTTPTTYFVDITDWRSWTPSDVNSSDFYVKVTHVNYIDPDIVYLDYMPIIVISSK